MAKKLKIIIATIVVFASALGVSAGRAGALPVTNGNVYGTQFKVSNIRLDDGAIYVVNNDNNLTTPVIERISILSTEIDLNPAELDPDSDRVVQLSSALVAPGGNVQAPGGSLRLVIDNLVESTKGIFYVFVDFIDGRQSTLHRVDFTGCLKTAGNNLTGVYCYPRTESDRSVIYEAYMGSEKLTPKETEVLSSDNDDNPNTGTVDPSEGSAENPAKDNTPDDVTPGKTESQPQPSPESPIVPERDVVIDSSIAKATVAVAPRANPLQDNGPLTISSNKNVKNTQADTQNDNNGAAIADTTNSAPPSGNSQVDPEPTNTPSVDNGYAWWALLPLVILIVILILSFFVKRKRIVRLGL